MMCELGDFYVKMDSTLSAMKKFAITWKLMKKLDMMPKYLKYKCDSYDIMAELAQAFLTKGNEYFKVNKFFNAIDNYTIVTHALFRGFISSVMCLPWTTSRSRSSTSTRSRNVWSMCVACSSLKSIRSSCSISYPNRPATRTANWQFGAWPLHPVSNLPGKICLDLCGENQFGVQNQ